MKRFLAQTVILLLILSFTSCTSDEVPDSESTATDKEPAESTAADWYYVPADEWAGAETCTYSLFFADYVASNPLGSPDPTPNADDKQGGVDIARIDFRTKEKQYSISAKATVTFEITYSKTDKNKEEDYVIWNAFDQNLERWTGDTWERLIDINVFAIATGMEDYLEKTTIYSGTTVEGVFYLDAMASKLTPGKYRLVAYINYQPIYAEFELIE